jgi:methane/ammonia monooxygenase subunit B
VRSRLRSRLISWLTGLLLIAGTLCGAPKAFAHGEAADEPFLKDMTVAFYDTHISPTQLKVGEPVTITGSVKVLPIWPFTLDPPNTAYISPVIPGPVFVLVDRTVNGVPMIGSINIQRDGIYNYTMKMIAREPGRWHVHPGFAVEGTGTLIGPGLWVNVAPSEKPFAFNVQLLNGKTVDLETLGGAGVWWWPFAGLILGVAWMVYWTVPLPIRPDRRTVHNLAVTVQLPTWDQGRDFGLVTEQDHRISTWIAVATLALLIVGWIHIEIAYPLRLKQQTDRFAPPQPDVTEMAKVLGSSSIYDPSTHTLTLNMDLKNIGSTPITIKQFSMAMMSFVKGDKEALENAGPPDYVAPLEVEGSNPIPAGQTAKITLKMSSDMMEDERLIPLNDPQEVIGGLLFVEDANGTQSSVTVRSELVPTAFTQRYL